MAGDAVNTAARVQAAAEPGQVLADGATQRLAGGAVGFADAGEHALKGKAEPAAAVAGDPGAGRGGRVAAGGRAGGAADRPGRGAAHGQGAVPRGGGAAGAAAGAGVRARPGWASRGWAGSSRSTSMAWRRRCGGTGAGACPTGRGWRSGRWPRWSGSGWASPRRTRPRPRRGSWPRGWTGSSPTRVSGRMWGRGWAGCSAWPRRGTAGPRWRREELFAGWRLFFERLAAEQPVVLVVEDAQYADAGLLDFLDYLIDWVAGPAGLRAGVRPARAGPGPAGVRRRAGTGPR